MAYIDYPAPNPMLFGYDPVRDLPADHLARLIDAAVDEYLRPDLSARVGYPSYDPRLLTKVLIYGYCTGVRSSRQLERNCAESLPYLLLTRGGAVPSFKTLCNFRNEFEDLIEEVWVGTFIVAEQYGLKRVGRVTIDSTKIRADVSTESILREEEYTAVRAEFTRIVIEAKEQDGKDDDDPPGTTRLGKEVSRDTMRDILRRIRKRSAKPEPGRISPKMLKRLEAGIDAINQAAAEGRKHVCLTDPDARMMPEGRQKHILPCHSLEVAVDNGLLVAGEANQEHADSKRLTPLVEAAKLHEPNGVSAVDADSGYYSADGLLALLEAGIDTCIPDGHTACDLHRGDPIGTSKPRKNRTLAFEYNAETDTYTCPKDNVLSRVQSRVRTGREQALYRAGRDCIGCEFASQCLDRPNAKRRVLTVSRPNERLSAAKQRFAEPDHRERYRHRCDVVETVFGFVRGTLGYNRWQVRGKNVAGEGALIILAYQFRKICTQILRQNLQLRAA